MAFNITIQDTRVESKGKYQVCVVTYTYKGQQKTQNLMSFANPQVFKDVQGFHGQEVTVEVTKNDKGYDQWAKVYAAGSGGGGAAPAPAAKSGGSYETAAERAQRQVMIVRQSSLGHAVATLTPGSKAPLNPEEVINVAKLYEGYVFGTEKYLDPSE